MIRIDGVQSLTSHEANLGLVGFIYVSLGHVHVHTVPCSARLFSFFLFFPKVEPKGWKILSFALALS